MMQFHLSVKSLITNQRKLIKKFLEEDEKQKKLEALSLMN